MDSTFPSLRLGLTRGVARQGGTSGRDGVFGIGLALAPPALPIGSVNFDDADAFSLEMPGQPRSIGACSFDADQLDRAEVAQPGQQLLVALNRGVEALDAEKSALII